MADDDEMLFSRKILHVNLNYISKRIPVDEIISEILLIIEIFHRLSNESNLTKLYRTKLFGIYG